MQIKYWTSILGLSLWAVLQANAQPFGGGGGGFGAGGFGGGARSSASRQYPSSGQIGDAYFSIDPETRRVVVIAPEDAIPYITQVLTNLDRPKPQVLIKVVFLEVTRNDALDIGVEGGFQKNVNGSTTGSGSQFFGFSGLGSTVSNVPLNAYGLPISGFGNVPPGAGLYQVLGQDYQVTLRAIAQAGRAKVLSRPSILARNNQPATILVGQTVPLITSVTYNTITSVPISGITYTDVGIILRVTPFITADGMVEMIVSPEISSVSSAPGVPIGGGATAPLIDKRSADTVVVTGDGQTVIIGGLIQDQKATTESKIPFLGDIPGLGVLFKRKTTASTKTELLIFLTPHVVQSTSQLASLSTKERETFLKPKTFTEQELDQFFDRLPTKESAPPKKQKKND